MANLPKTFYKVFVHEGGELGSGLSVVFPTDGKASLKRVIEAYNRDHREGPTELFTRLEYKGVPVDLNLKVEEFARQKGYKPVEDIINLDLY